MKKIGIALSGGGSRGIVHLGILKAIDEAKIPIEMMTMGHGTMIFIKMPMNKRLIGNNF